MDTSAFDYYLPTERIAQNPANPRESARLLVMDRKMDVLQDRTIADLPDLLSPGDLLVFNDSKVFKARLHATRETTTFEVFLLRPVEHTTQWIALLQPARKLSPEDTLVLADGTTVTLHEKRSDGTCVLETHRSADAMFAVCDTYGEVPTPPYVEQGTDLNAYQTAYAKTTGSVAAPTAGLHFTPALLDTLEKRGVQRAFVTLHVGLGTFRPMKTDTLEAHVMHEEWAHVSQETLDAITATRARGGRVIAVGTTTVRALESARGTPFSGYTRLFITPGHTFTSFDALITNFHLPKSTLLVLVSAFAGRESTLNAYQHAIDQGYRFYSFGDAMLIT